MAESSDNSPILTCPPNCPCSALARSLLGPASRPLPVPAFRPSRSSQSLDEYLQGLAEIIFVASPSGRLLTKNGSSLSLQFTPDDIIVATPSGRLLAESDSFLSLQFTPDDSAPPNFQISPLGVRLLGTQLSPVAPMESPSFPDPSKTVENSTTAVIHHPPSSVPSPAPPSPPDTPPGSPSPPDTPPGTPTPPPSPGTNHPPLSGTNFCVIPSDSLPPSQFPSPPRIRPPPPSYGCCSVL